MKATFGTLRQLGYELISSEAVAINELIKNAIDARASVMEIVFFENKIILIDNGEGIPLKILEEIGEYISKSSKKGNTIQHGDKGLGRLATQRIGNKLKIISWNKNFVNCQKIDWSILEQNREKDISEFNPKIDDSITRKDIPYLSSSRSISGTAIEVSELIKFRSSKKEDVEEFIRNHYKKFFNVLDTQNERLDLTFFYGDEKLQIPEFPGDLLEYEHASFDMKYISSTGKINYKLSIREEKTIKKEKTIDIHYADIKKYFFKRGQLREKNRHGILLRDLLKCDWEKMNDSVLKKVGDFKVDLHWLNRQRIIIEFKNKVKKSDGKASDKVKEVNEWNTIALYRNDIMVYPYGAGASDWLALDATALSRQGYKFNKQQLIGAISISKENNNGLVDTTNRQELIHNKDYETFIMLCYYLINRYFFDAVTENSEEKKRRETKEFIPGLKKAIKDLSGIDLSGIDCNVEYPVCEILEEVAKLDPNKYPTIIVCSLRTLLEACLKYEFNLPHNEEIKIQWIMEQEKLKKKGKRYSPYEHGQPTTISEFRKVLRKNLELKTSLDGISSSNVAFLSNIAHGKQIVSSGKCEDLIKEIKPIINIIVGGKSGKKDDK